MFEVIQTNNLTKYYGKRRGIENVNLVVQEGEIFGFIGPNGAGKSTTIRTLLSLIRPTSGNARIFGLDCLRHRTQILKEVGYLPGEVFYYDKMKAEQLLRYSASFYKKNCNKKIKYLCDALSLNTKDKIESMSLGNRKKVGIVQCLLHSPKLIILDEPTSGLDPLMQKTFFELLQEENAKGATVLLSSHVLSEVQHNCDTVAIIKQGSIVNVERVDKLTGSYYKRVNITLKQAVAGSFGLIGATHVAQEGNRLQFLYKGNGEPLIQALASLPIADITITEPTLEEIFMNYYSDEVHS